jgi:hypothetical protein
LHEIFDFCFFLQKSLLVSWLILVSLPQECFQEIKRMDDVDHTFLTCTQKLYLSLYLQPHIINYLGLTPLVNGKRNPTYLESRDFAHGGESPSTLIPCLVATAHPLLYNPPHPSHPSSPHYVTMTLSTISVFLVWNNTRDYFRILI